MSVSKKNAIDFVTRWQKNISNIPQGKNNEQQDTQKFWMDLLINVLGIKTNTIDTFIDFERHVQGRRIDVFVSDRHFLCEQKSVGVDLDKPESRNKTLETPYQQARWYAQNLPYSERPRWLMTSNFETFRLYDLDNERPEDFVQEISLAELPNQLHLFSFLTNEETGRLYKEQQLSVEAGKYVSKLYDALAKQYHHIDGKDEEAQEEQRSLNVLITRIIFLLYAEDADLLQSHQAFGNYCEGDSSKLRRKLIDLFEVIDTPVNHREEYLDSELQAFPYVNGGLFADRSIIIPQMTDEISLAIIESSKDFDWREISGVIFGGVFEGTLNPETRRSGGMHYTSVENIERCLRPLFLDTLWSELNEAEKEKSSGKRKQALKKLHDKIANITIGDPACGSGNFLTEAYRQLRSIENRIIESELSEETSISGQTALASVQENPVRVSLNQLYGIEINDFAVAVAKTALWITEEQMLRKTQEIYSDYDFDFLPLKSLTNLKEGNALTMDWEDVFPKDISYIVGNPPFVGARLQSKEQKAELLSVFEGAKNAGNIDYCGAWYYKAAKFIKNTKTACALVSTNSICQGEQAAILWKPIFDLGIHIDFAHNTFRWDNEAADKAHVFCIIVGFSAEGHPKKLYIHKTPDSVETIVYPKNINAYLVDSPNVFVWNRKTPICNVQEMKSGNQPIDNGYYLFTEQEKEEFLACEPEAQEYFYRFIGGQEFLNGKSRWCLWLGNLSFNELKNLPKCRERVDAVRNFRLASKRISTIKLAEKPTRFQVETMPKGHSIIIPETSSERRNYIPVGFVDPDTLCSNAMLLIPDATLYQFGILQSLVHNAWMRTVAGRLKSDYRYSAGIVYNNFVWPNVSEVQISEIERCAKAVIDIRKQYSDLTLAEMYDPRNSYLVPNLIKAHYDLDNSVENAYGIQSGGNEEKIISHLFMLYNNAINSFVID
jgi:hypothetical protein